MFGGLFLAILTMLAVEGGQDNAWWFVALLPIAALLFFVVRAGYRYGKATARSGVDLASGQQTGDR